MKIISFFFLECNGELSNETRIRMSLVRIMHSENRIQTGAYSKTCKKIFALNTARIRYFTDDVKDFHAAMERKRNNIIYPLYAYNEIGNIKFISHRTDDGENMINLMVC